MPTINFIYRDFENLLGRRLAVDKFSELSLLYAKAEVDEYNSKTGELKISLDDTNLPYLWSVEGLARFFKGVLDIETGMPKLKTQESGFRIIVDKNIKKYRPYVAAFVAEGKKLNNYFLEQLIQLQEKFCEGYGRQRQKVSIGLYSHKKIRFPVHYKAVKPDAVTFTPLEAQKEMRLPEVLQTHPKGRQYGWIIERFDKYPLLMDDKGEVLSLVPIINSNSTGKLVVGDSEMLFEATGTDEDAVNLAANIFAQNLSDRGFKISEVTIVDGKKKHKTPHQFKEKNEVNPEQVESLIGLRLNDSEIKKFLEKARYGVSGNTVEIPDFRRDILHISDVIEDIAIMYGFNKMESASITSSTSGSPTEMNVFIDKIREIAIGLGFQEILSPVLSNKGNMQVKMNERDANLVEIENIMSETYSAVRSWLTPVLLEVLSKNKHNDFPQKIFEEGIVNIKKDNKIKQAENIGLVVSHTNADFTEAKQILDAFMESLGVKYNLKSRHTGSFIRGRAGSIMVKGKQVGVIGEISPQVLVNWDLEMPVAAVELDLTELKKFTSDA